jgi:hypothetical protein
MEQNNKTLDDLLNLIQATIQDKEDDSFRPLDEYLCALWKLVQQERGSLVTYTLLAKLLTRALKAPPAPFDPDWLKYTLLPKRRETDHDYDYLSITIQCQIADLFRMKGMDLSPAQRYGGVWLPTGNAWHNFHVTDYLGQAVAGFRAHNRLFQKNLPTVIGRDPQSTQCDWFILAEFLALGQIYE